MGAGMQVACRSSVIVGVSMALLPSPTAAVIAGV